MKKRVGNSFFKLVFLNLKKLKKMTKQYICKYCGTRQPIGALTCKCGSVEFILTDVIPNSKQEEVWLYTMNGVADTDN